MTSEGGSPALVVEVFDNLAVIRFNRPAGRNPLSSATLEHLDTNISRLTTRADLSAIIFTGAADVFASGADIRELAQLDPSSARAFSELGQALMQKIADASQLTIAAINGYCMGGALDLTLACNVRIASHRAVFAHPGSQLGIITGWGGTQRLPRLIGESFALELLMTARRINATEALRIGLISAIADPVLNTAIETARQARRAL